MCPGYCFYAPLRKTAVNPDEVKYIAHKINYPVLLINFLLIKKLCGYTAINELLLNNSPAIYFQSVIVTLVKLI